MRKAISTSAILALAALSLLAGTASAHGGGRYGTVRDMEATLQRGGALLAVCSGRGEARKNGYPRQFWGYRHFLCMVIDPYGKRWDIFIHTLADGRWIVTSRTRR
jgi:hypothetical protein